MTKASEASQKESVISAGSSRAKDKPRAPTINKKESKVLLELVNRAPKRVTAISSNTSGSVSLSEQQYEFVVSNYRQDAVYTKDPVRGEVICSMERVDHHFVYVVDGKLTQKFKPKKPSTKKAKPVIQKSPEELLREEKMAAERAAAVALASQRKEAVVLDKKKRAEAAQLVAK